MSRPVVIPKPAESYCCVVRDGADTSLRERTVPEETAVALVYGGSTEAVMMATPADFEDFAVGFSLTEGLIERADEIADLSVVHNAHGVELRMWLDDRRGKAHRHRRRRLAGPTGCGLCGIESLSEAVRPVRAVPDGAVFHHSRVADAIAAVTAAQRLNHQTHATHAAAFFSVRDGLVAIREDVGRHNALDKLAGAMCRSGTAGEGGAVVITSRVSVEMVQKTVAIGAPVLIAMSAPTALAVRAAVQANLTLVAVARGQSSEVFTGTSRLGLS
jgi:FdhD protein